MYKKQPFKSKTMTILAITLISSIFLLSSTIAGNSDARKMGPYSCTPVGSGVTKCCAVDLDTTRTWCTFCNDTNPPSGCLSADPINNEGNDNTIPESPGGGVLNNEDESSESEDTNPKNMGDNVLNDGSSSGSSESGSFDPDKIAGGGFNQ